MACCTGAYPAARPSVPGKRPWGGTWAWPARGPRRASARAPRAPGKVRVPRTLTRRDRAAPGPRPHLPVKDPPTPRPRALTRQTRPWPRPPSERPRRTTCGGAALHASDRPAVAPPATPGRPSAVSGPRSRARLVRCPALSVDGASCTPARRGTPGVRLTPLHGGGAGPTAWGAVWESSRPRGALTAWQPPAAVPAKAR